MADWSASMQQTYEYYVVDPATWRNTKKLDNVKSCSINRDMSARTLGSASFDIDGELDECYIRVYLVTIQNGVTERHPLGTFLAQTPSISFNGKVKSISMDAYTPLLELKEKQTPIGYSAFKNDNVMSLAYRLTRENLRAPVSETECDITLEDDFVADTNDTWIDFIIDLIANAKYSLDIDELGRILFSPNQATDSLQPVWTYNDDNSSILYPDLTLNRDLYGIPNVVEVIYSAGDRVYTTRVVNDDPNSPTSTVNRGREIVYRDTSPSLVGYSSDEQIDEYANQLLRSLSTIEYTVTYTHGYCPVRLGDCVRLNYTRGDMKNVKARVISQTIKCESGCSVTEKAVFTKKLWG